jgi:hypothetical protein
MNVKEEKKKYNEVTEFFDKAIKTCDKYELQETKEFEDEFLKETGKGKSSKKTEEEKF